MTFPTGLKLYSDEQSKPQDWLPGLVANIYIPPPELKGHPVQLIVIINPELARKNLEAAMTLTSIYPLVPPVAEKLTEVGLQAVNLEDVPEDQRAYWRQEADNSTETTGFHRERLC
ncbi:MAG: hypothetical protein NTY06_04425 [Candidatus Gottesmanbacteria bacterium]|nr:hypothetical protein [Candidatus Gottesmanbacteria bacterium]